MEPEIIAAIGPKALTPEIADAETRAELAASPVFRELREESAKLVRESYVALHKQHAAIGRDNAATEFKACNELGVLYLRLPQKEYFRMRDLYDAEFGGNCWEDPEFVEAYRMDNPWAAVRTTRGTRGQEYAGMGVASAAAAPKPNLRESIAEQRTAEADFAQALQKPDPAPVSVPNLRDVIAEQHTAEAEFTEAVSPWKRIADEEQEGKE